MKNKGDTPKTSEWTTSSIKPELWSEEQLQYSAETWGELERQEHDERYADTYPFGLDSYRFTPEHVLWYEDYAYKKGRRRDRGDRTRKVFELMDLPNLSGKKVLDIGCGIGQYSVFMAMHGAEVTGIELSPVAIEIAERMARENEVDERCHFIAGEFTSAPLAPESFDVVLLHEVYHHLIKYTDAKEKIMTMARPGGRILVADTIQGSGLIHMGRRLTKFVRYTIDPASKEHEVHAGDVLLSMEDYHELGRRGSSYEIHPMSYLYMIKQTGLQYHTDRAVVRGFLRMAKLADNALLTLVPPLKKHCGEAVLCITK